MPEVVVYSSPTCSSCDALKHFLEEKGVSYREINVAQDMEAAERVIRLTDQAALPVVEVDGQVIVGFDRQRLSQILALEP